MDDIRYLLFIYFTDLETLYDQLQRGDVNSHSVYQTLGPQQTSSDFTDNEGCYALLDNFLNLFHILSLLNTSIK